MKHLSILVPRGQNNLSSVVGPFKIFNRANQYFEQAGKHPVFAIKLVGTGEKVDFYHGLFTVNVQRHIGEIDQTDLIIIPSLNHHYEEAIAGNEALISWIYRHYKSGTEIASICTGAFLLAASGALDGKSCSTHWAAAEHFRRMFPRVRLETDQLITDENGIYTNGGAYSFLNLMIYLVEKYYNRETAIFCAKVFQIDLARNLQSEFSIFNGHKQHDDEVIQEAQIYLEENYREKISIQELARKLNVGRRNFDRRFKKATNFTPLEYLQRIKVEAAKKFFENTRLNVNEVMYDVGYSDSKAFREVFCRITGLSPLEYRTRYNAYETT
ncbi:GlxA family transcriptional regulator [Flavilitoribacter nigricans]|uniref:AraC family transcriptional regulator n=1 Tax=Flavilitoribacter nigricans (strain ATCC 23147 / DSM 23189 / NBRC 102662 / NCIMB 1420 / SS-2) TaxID=1122177 RepID=A0A2D0N424_FLAN2|nr:helix-turn-helix domain-containing protein [Flavilitoribacter nigricans]PHN02513.1 AraC family transcriptional regulator [Flavilitoribacter nigricans DSM 23189 = NBRC 102662]